MSVNLRIKSSGSTVTTQLDDTNDDLTGLVTPVPTSTNATTNFDTSSYQTTSKTVQLSDGSSVSLPTVTQEQLQSVFGNLTDEQKKSLLAQGRSIANTILSANSDSQTSSSALSTSSGALTVAGASNSGSSSDNSNTSGGRMYVSTLA